MSARYAALAVLLCSWLVASCTFHDKRQRCEDISDCTSADSRCYEGFCIPKKTPTGMEQNPGGGRGGRSGGDAGRSTAGAAAEGGTSSPDGGDQTDPDAAVGGNCTDDAMRACEAAWEDAVGLGGCGPGSQRCVNGVWGSCTPDRMMIGPEVCNGLDDDCDGDVDEDSNVQCYPAGAGGCESTEQGQFNCNAPCRAGMQRCVDGNLGQCAGYMVAATTDNCSTEQIDENCDGTPNDNCQCNGNEARDCYTGPAETQGVGICVAGRQSCVNGRWAACTGAITQRVEVCNGDDDDCDRSVDNVVGVGNRCTVAGARGVCAEGTFRCQAGNPAPQCVATSPQASAESCNGRDDDCNGMVDDVLAAQLQTDPMHCGACNRACGANDKCCAGQCVNSNENTNHCGVCGRSCRTGETCVAGMCMSQVPPDAGTMCDSMRPCATAELCCGGRCVPNDAMNCGTCGTVCGGAAQACCSNLCVDLSQNGNCGRCGNVCPTPDGGAACTCATTGTAGVFECRNGPLACQ